MCPGCGARGCGCSSAPALTHWEFIPNTTPADTGRIRGGARVSLGSPGSERIVMREV